MIRTHRLAVAVAALLSLSVVPAMAQTGARPAEMNSETVTVEASPGASGGAQFVTATNPLLVLALGAPDPMDLSLLAERRRNQDKHGQPLEIAFGRETAGTSVALSKLQWQPLAGGAQGAQLRVQSDGALALRAALDFADTNRGARPDLNGLTLRFRGDDGQTFEVAGQDLSNTEQNWSPVVRGQAMTIEIVAAAGSRVSGYSLRIPQLSHFDVNPASTDQNDFSRL